ncbi:M50 family metallopeptidase [Baaleninema simplex]|uniref:M50 family metallopeptidase n=1 Tax=Baaleninema simplex TaxID=2862350 RepID=UPI00034B076B|nr:M50 family metallopeptidase [Baaleninema simplex]
MVTGSRLPTAIAISDDWICPDIRPYWQLLQLKQDNRVLLRSRVTAARFQLSGAEGYALRYFVGKYSVAEVQRRCQREFTVIDAQLVTGLIQKLVDLGVLALDSPNSPPSSNASPRFKAGVEWVKNPDGYWVLRNPIDRTYLQVSAADKAAIDAKLGDDTTTDTAIDPQQWRKLLQLLAATGMLEGTEPQKRKRGKFNPMQLLFFRVPLLNPDNWLTRHIDRLRWLWTRGFGWSLTAFLVASLVVGLSQQGEILDIGTQLWTTQGGSLMLPFVLLALTVVSVHELGHAFTLKHYGGVVPEMGLLFMCLFPAAYTNTTDSYCLSRWQRLQVVGVGVLTQISIAAIALWTWNLSIEGSWLYTASYLLMASSLFTVALNLNPLAKFDGYHLAVATTGINNLRSRSFGFYKNLLQGKPIRETSRDRKILAVYAPLSLVYICSVFGFLFFRLMGWTLTNIPAIALFLVELWAIYYIFAPED